MIAIGEAATVIKSVTVPDDLHGHATLFVNAGTRQQSIRAVLKLFAEHGPKYKGETAKLIFTQQVPKVKSVQRVGFNGVAPVTAPVCDFHALLCAAVKQNQP